MRFTPIRLTTFYFTLLLSVQPAAADLLNKEIISSQEKFKLNEILDQADITDKGDINLDGITDYIITYKESASNYGEFLYNVVISDGDSYRSGFKYDDYFINLQFQGTLVIGTRRESATTVLHQQYVYDTAKKTLEEKPPSS